MKMCPINISLYESNYHLIKKKKCDICLRHNFFFTACPKFMLSQGWRMGSEIGGGGGGGGGAQVLHGGHCHVWV